MLGAIFRKGLMGNGCGPTSDRRLFFVTYHHPILSNICQESAVRLFYLRGGKNDTELLSQN